MKLHRTYRTVWRRIVQDFSTFCWMSWLWSELRLHREYLFDFEMHLLWGPYFIFLLYRTTRNYMEYMIWIHSYISRRFRIVRTCNVLTMTRPGETWQLICPCPADGRCEERVSDSNIINSIKWLPILLLVSHSRGADLKSL